jgi:hypothetical protein
MQQLENAQVACRQAVLFVRYAVRQHEGFDYLVLS